MFLHSPPIAFASICQIEEMSGGTGDDEKEEWTRYLFCISELEREIEATMVASVSLLGGCGVVIFVHC